MKPVDPSGASGDDLADESFVDEFEFQNEEETPGDDEEEENYE